MNTKTLSLAVLALACAAASAAQEWKPLSAGEAEAGAAVIKPADELTWKDTESVKGGRTAVLWGDPKEEAYGQLNRWPGGAEIPLHWHPFELHAVVLEGTLTVSVEGAPVKELGPGSYLRLPGRLAHVMTCKPGAECVFLTTSRLRYETRMGRPKGDRGRQAP